MLSIINQKNKIIIDKEDEKDRIELNLQVNKNVLI